jgi:c-di-GMP-binding flagellar brake protein YcgR
MGDRSLKLPNRRIARRYDLSIPIVVHASIEKEQISGTGNTRDISTGGVYFTIDNHLSVGAELNLRMTLPTEVTGENEVFIRATGKVIRVDKHSGNENEKLGIAAIFEMREIARN